MQAGERERARAGGRRHGLSVAATWLFVDRGPLSKAEPRLANCTWYNPVKPVTNGPFRLPRPDVGMVDVTPTVFSSTLPHPPPGGDGLKTGEAPFCFHVSRRFAHETVVRVLSNLDGIGPVSQIKNEDTSNSPDIQPMVRRYSTGVRCIETVIEHLVSPCESCGRESTQIRQTPESLAEKLPIFD